MKSRFAYLVISFFILYGILFIPYPYHLLPFQRNLVQFIFYEPVILLARVFNVKNLHHFDSDTTSLYLLILLLLVLSLLCSFLFWFIKRVAFYIDPFIRFVNRFSPYYLVMILFKYGLDKIFLHQFYTPDPNTLFNSVGNMEREFLYWTSMGTAPVYSIFLGSMEVLAAVLIFFRKTRMAGLLIAGFILTDVIAINFGFDISVKLFSIFLLCIDIYLLIPFLPSLIGFFFTGKSQKENRGVRRVNSKASFTLKWLFSLFIIAEGFYPFFTKTASNQFQQFVGAYNVLQDASGNSFRRFYIHRKGYLILEKEGGQLENYQLALEKTGKYVLLSDRNRHQFIIPYTYSDSIFSFTDWNNNSQFIKGKRINYDNMPLLKRGFHWTVDGE